MYNLINKKMSKIYLLFYLIYIIITTFSEYTTYSRYLKFIYTPLNIMAVIISLIYLLIFQDNCKYKSNWDYTIAIGTIFILSIEILFKLKLVMLPLMAIYLFIANLKYINLRYFIKLDLKVKLFLITIIPILFICHLTPNHILTHRNGILRIGAGFEDYNTFAGFVLCVIFSLVLFIGKKSYKFLSILSILFICILVFYLTDSRGFIISSLLLLIFLCIGRVRFIKRAIELISILLVVLFSIMAVIIPIKVPTDSMLFYYINRFSSGRLIIQHLVMQFYSLSLSGNFNGSWMRFFNSGQPVYIDNSYLMLILINGILGFLLFEFILVHSCYVSFYLNDYLLCIIFISLSLFFMVENVFSDVDFYTPFIYIIVCYTNYKNNTNNTNNNEEGLLL